MCNRKTQNEKKYFTSLTLELCIFLLIYFREINFTAKTNILRRECEEQKPFYGGGGGGGGELRGTIAFTR